MERININDGEFSYSQFGRDNLNYKIDKRIEYLDILFYCLYIFLYINNCNCFYTDKL